MLQTVFLFYGHGVSPQSKECPDSAVQESTTIRLQFLSVQCGHVAVVIILSEQGILVFSELVEGEKLTAVSADLFQTGREPFRVG